MRLRTLVLLWRRVWLDSIPVEPCERLVGEKPLGYETSGSCLMLRLYQSDSPYVLTPLATHVLSACPVHATRRATQPCAGKVGNSAASHDSSQRQHISGLLHTTSAT